MIRRPFVASGFGRTRAFVLVVCALLAALTVRESAQSTIASMTYPADGATIQNFTQPYAWTSVPGAQAYYLYVGTTPGAKDLVNSGETQATSWPMKALPYGTTLYARINTKLNGHWQYVDSTFQTGNPPAQFVLPTDGSTVDLSQPFSWTPVAGAQAYYLYVGTTPGANDLVNSGEIQQTSYTAGALPSGVTLYARIYTKRNGVWENTQVSFTANPIANFLYPTNGASNVDLTRSFQWTVAANVQAYYLYVGSSFGANDLVNTGEIQQTSYTVPTLPAGPTLYARLHTKQNGAWKHVDITFTAAPRPATFVFPANNAVNADLFTRAISWTSVPGAQAYYLYVGTSSGANDLVNTGEIQTTSFAATALPGNVTLYGRIYTKVNGAWLHSDITFTALPPPARFVTPVAGATNVSAASAIQWTSASAAQAYYLYVGTTSGATDVVNSGEIQTTSYLPPAFPSGQLLYARIYTKQSGAWRYSAITFTSALIAATFTTPMQGGVLDEQQALRWTAVSGAQAYSLTIGSTPGGADLVSTGEIGTTSYTPPVLPTGQALYARVGTKVGGAWSYSDVSFTVAAMTARLSFPAAGARGVNGLVPFQWNAIDNVQAYYLYVGTSPGAKDVVNTGEIHTTQYTPQGLPPFTTLYARLYTKVGGAWRSAPDVQFTSGTLTAQWVFPSRGSVGVVLNQPFQWSPVDGAAGYRLVISSTSSGTDLLDTGTIQGTTYSVTSLPADRILYARVYTLVNGVWRYADSIFTLMPSASPAAMTYPLDGDTAVDAGQPFQWAAADIADAYRLELGTTPGSHDLHDSGPIRATRRFVPSLPIGATIYGRLSSRVGGHWYETDFSFTAVSNAIATATRIDSALWATHAVRSMSEIVGSAFIGTELADVLASQQVDRAVCTDYAAELVLMLGELNIGLPVQILNIAFNPNHYDEHTLVEMQNDQTGQWMILDPTFDASIQRSGDQTWATAEDVSAATRAQQWGDVSYVFLGSRGDYYARTYYLDYPLLWVNVYHLGQAHDVSAAGTVLPYLQIASIPVSAAWQPYAIGCSGTPDADLEADDVDTVFACDGADSVSRVFFASVLTPTSLTPAITLYQPRRYLF